MNELLKGLKKLGIEPQTVLNSALHAATPTLGKLAFKEAFARTSDEACRKLGRLLEMAGQKLQKLDRDGAAGDCGRVLGEIKLQ